MTIVMLSASTAFASISKEEASVAGLYLGETTEMVEDAGDCRGIA